MRGFVGPIEQMALENEAFRKVLYTASHSQLVLMSLKPGEEIGEEVHHLDQFFRIETGEGECVLDGANYTIRDGTAILVPSGVRHNVLNTGTKPMKLYTLYAPPNHRDGVVHRTREEAMADEGEHFDGFTSE